MSRSPFRHLAWFVPAMVAAVVVVPLFAGSEPAAPRGLPDGPADLAQVLRGRLLAVNHDCGACHGGGANPAAEGWLAGVTEIPPDFVVGEFKAAPANLTPDRETGTGRWTDRQLFNALRYGLRPSATAEITVTSSTPGMGNHPARPSYLAPMMPWASYRHMSDRELWDIIAYLRHLQPVRTQVPPGAHPPDGWASANTVEAIGAHPAPAFPTAHEELRDAARRGEVLRGRELVVQIGCGECHGGRSNPAMEGWLVGVLPGDRQGTNGGFVAPFHLEFPFGKFTTYPRNLTPDNVTGMGRFSERQVFNALRYGLRPGETADVEITSTVPGQGNHPQSPKYLAPPMPWPAWRHLSDADLRAIAAYLKLGVKPVRNVVQDSEGPPDFWAAVAHDQDLAPYPLPAFPTARERRP